MLEHGIEWEKKGTHEKAFICLWTLRKKERAKEVAELEQSISDGIERLSDIQIQHRKSSAGNRADTADKGKQPAGSVGIRKQVIC